MMEQIAICVGSTVIYWSSVTIALAIASAFALSFALYTANGGKSIAMWAYLPTAVFLSVVFSRFIHWYCHSEQYNGMLKALTDYSTGGYCLPGVMAGMILAVFIVSAMKLIPNKAELFDALAPGAALGFALIRLSSLFTSFCRGKIVIENPKFQQLPLGSGIITTSGEVQYRFASFFVSFILLSLLCAALLCFYGRNRSTVMKCGLQKGNVALMFLLYFASGEFIIDSSRYDSSFLRSNGFVSLMQIICAVIFVSVLLYYSINSVKANGVRRYHYILWLVFLAAVGCTGYFEYLIQRHGDWYMLCYGVMTLTCTIMAAVPTILYISCRAEK